jgi:hypothetical protein
MIMKKINQFSINTEKDPYKKSRDLVNFIEKQLNKKNFKIFIKRYSKATGLPKGILDYEIKQILSRTHNFENGRFKSIFNFTNIFKSSFIFFFTTLYILIFSKKMKKNIFFDVIFDEIESMEELSRINILKKNFKSYGVISNTKNFKNINLFYFNKFKYCDKKYILSNFYLFFIGYLIIAIKFSIKEKCNYIPLAANLIKQNIKYRTIFGQVKANHLHQERHYTTSSIKNYLFKRFGGKTVSCIQKNLIHLHSTGFYINTDIFFTLGRKTSLTIKFCGSKIKKIIPVGSIYIESKWLKSKKIKVPEYDIINFGGNNMFKFATNKNFLKNYYETFNWLNKISKEYPNLRIAVKHHFNNKYVDPMEIKILKKSNVKIIVSKGEADKNYSYGYAFKAKFACTFASTIAYELIGHNKPCFFLDPDGKNLEFLNNERYNNNWKIKSYHEFKKKVEEFLITKKKYSVKDKENFCLKSDNVSRKIANILKIYKNKI